MEAITVVEEQQRLLPFVSFSFLEAYLGDKKINTSRINIIDRSVTKVTWGPSVDNTPKRY